MADSESRDGWFKALAVVAPLFASSLAISYDVGFFFGLDIGVFTFFSLSEHVVFALQAIPFALVPALGIIGCIAIYWFAYHKIASDNIEVVEKVQKMSSEERETFVAKWKRKQRYIRLLDPLVQVAVFAVALWQFTKHNYTMAFLILVSQIIAKIVYPIDRWESVSVRYLLTLLCVTASWATAFSIGYERSEAVMSSKVPTERIFVEENEIPAKVIRGGERGVLFKSFDAGKLGFLRWDKIQRIEGF